MDYKKMYAERLISVDEALGKVKDGDRIFTSTAAMEPQCFLSNLHKLHGKVKDISVYTTLLIKSYPFEQDEQYKSTFDCNSFFMMGASRKAFQAGITSPVPGHLHAITTRYTDEFPVNVFVCSCTPMDKHGYVRSSMSLISEKEVFRAADLVIFEVNKNVPVVYGDNEFHISEIDYLYEADYDLPVLAESAPTEVDIQIGKHVAGLINDGDTLQIGIGAIPDAVALSLTDKKDLGIHTEMLTSSIADLYNAGVINGKSKTLNNRKIVAAFILGSQKLYDFAEENPGVVLKEANYVNNPWVIAQNDNMVSINACVEVDFTGQICSESIGPRPFSGSGGQNDTAEGAIHAKGGRSIIAMHSTKKDGTISTIVPMLKEGAIVTLSRNNIDYVVTEYGVAKLKSRNLRERALSLIEIAHPKFRDELLAKARELKYIP